MKLIVGLGNPGEKYKNNRHNVGFMFVNYIANHPSIPSLKRRGQRGDNNITIQQYNNFILAKPLTFMNNSGLAVIKAINNYQITINDLIVAHDDLDIPLGKFKIQKSVGPKLHNGIKSIENSLGTKEFWRIRIGVDNRLALSDPDVTSGESRGWINGETYVLQNFKQKEKAVTNQMFPKIYNQLKTLFLEAGKP